MIQLLVDAAKPGASPLEWTATNEMELKKLYSLSHRLRWLRVRMKEDNHPLKDQVYSVAITLVTPKPGEPGWRKFGKLSVHRADAAFDDLLSSTSLKLEKPVSSPVPPIDDMFLEPEDEKEKS
jgi:hypothetical protein